MYLPGTWRRSLRFGTVHRVSTKITPNFRKIITHALHCGVRIPTSDIPDYETNLRERTEYPTELRLARNRVERRDDEHQPHLHLPFCCHSLSPFIPVPVGNQ